MMISVSDFKANMGRVLDSLTDQQPSIDITRSGKLVMLLSIEAPTGMPPMPVTFADLRDGISDLTATIVQLDARIVLHDTLRQRSRSIYLSRHVQYKPSYFEQIREAHEQAFIDSLSPDERQRFLNSRSVEGTVELLAQATSEFERTVNAAIVQYRQRISKLFDATSP